MSGLIEMLGLRDIVTVGQDWSGPISLRYAIEHTDNVRALVILNTLIEHLPGSGKERRERDIITGPLPTGYALLFKGGAYSSFLIRRLDFFLRLVRMKWRSGNLSRTLGSSFRQPVDPRVMENYLAIYDRPSKRAGLAAFPRMIPDRADHPNAARIDRIHEEPEHWHIPVQVTWWTATWHGMQMPPADKRGTAPWIALN